MYITPGCNDVVLIDHVTVVLQTCSTKPHAKFFKLSRDQEVTRRGQNVTSVCDVETETAYYRLLSGMTDGA